MGKSKSRILRKGINLTVPTISRQEAIVRAVNYLEGQNIQLAKDLITMFGLGAEELLEGGASYETVVAIKNILKS